MITLNAAPLVVFCQSIREKLTYIPCVSAVCVFVKCFLSRMQEPGMTKAYGFRQTDVPLQISISAQNMAARTKPSPVIMLPLQPEPGEYFVRGTVGTQLIGVTQR